jgi:hypothetical protein
MVKGVCAKGLLLRLADGEQGTRQSGLWFDLTGQHESRYAQTGSAERGVRRGIQNRGARGWNAAGEIALPLDFLQEEASQSPPTAIFTDLHVQISEWVVVMEQESAGGQDLSAEFENVFSDRLSRMRKDLVAGTFGAQKSPGNSEIRYAVVLKEYDVSGDVARELVEQRGKERDVALALNELRTRDVQKPAKEFDGKLAERKYDKKFEDRVAIGNFAAFDRAIANGAIIDGEQVRVGPSPFMARVVSNLTIRLLEEERSQGKDRFEFDFVDRNRHGRGFRFPVSFAARVWNEKGRPKAAHLLA